MTNEHEWDAAEASVERAAERREQADERDARLMDAAIWCADDPTHRYQGVQTAAGVVCVNCVADEAERVEMHEEAFRLAKKRADAAEDLADIRDTDHGF